jgi:hypothetical protein
LGKISPKRLDGGDTRAIFFSVQVEEDRPLACVISASSRIAAVRSVWQAPT